MQRYCQPQSRFPSVAPHPSPPPLSSSTPARTHSANTHREISELGGGSYRARPSPNKQVDDRAERGTCYATGNPLTAHNSQRAWGGRCWGTVMVLHSCPCSHNSIRQLKRGSAGKGLGGVRRQGAGVRHEAHGQFNARRLHQCKLRE